MRIVFLPTDERFCTKDYLLMLAKSYKIPVLIPDKFGYKKVPADTNYLSKWLAENVRKGDILIISLDMLLHGGLVPSRIDYQELETLLEKLKVLDYLKNQGAKIYASKSITRIPTYNSDDEEPDYWAYYGEKLYKYSLLLAKDENLKDVDIPEWILRDFTWRRNRNFAVLERCVELVEEKVIDRLNVMLDDNSPGSLVAYEADKISQVIKDKNLCDKISVRCGTDEVSLATLAQSLCEHFKITPKFKIQYSFELSKDFIPPYESSRLSESVPRHVRSVGGIISEDEDFDIFLWVHNFEGSELTREAPFQNEETGIPFLIPSISRDQVLAIADIRYANGSDRSLMKKLLSSDIDWTRTCYYGWNTAGNTLGSVCAHATVQYLGNVGVLKVDIDQLKKYQTILILEHYGYQSDVRTKLREDISKIWGKTCGTFLADENWAIKYVESAMEKYLEEVSKVFNKKWKLSVYFPWHRTFEVGLKLEEI